jgi:hypothetical protein
MSKKNLSLWSIITITAIVIGYGVKLFTIYLTPYFNKKFTNYTYPKTNERLIVAVEPYDAAIPELMLNVIKLAFYDREVIVDNNQPPHFIVRFEHVKKYNELKHWNAPYVTISGERWSLKRHKYRKNGPPIAEFVSALPKKTRELYFPFMLWCGVYPERKYTAEKFKPRKFLAYISSNCVKTREQLFALIKKLNPTAQSLGTCSNNENVRYCGNLDQAYAQYNFGFAMENHQIPGYITEKIINVFRGGAIPIYWGDSVTVNKYFNPKAFIDVGKFKNLQQAATYIVNLSAEQIQIMQQQPIFKDNKIPEIFKINDNPNHQFLKQAAEFIRTEYFKVLMKYK